MLYVVINTCANQAEDGRTWSGVPVQSRQYALRNFIIPWYNQILGGELGRLVVVGTWEEGPYVYLNSPSKHFNWNDALEQRQMAFEWLDSNKTLTEEDWILFQHDDHIVDIGNFYGDDDASVVVPFRWTRLRSPWHEPLNNGSSEGYIMGHAAYFRPMVIDDAPWTAVPKTERTWDVQHTKLVRDAGYSVLFSMTHHCWDVEMGASPWQ